MVAVRLKLETISSATSLQSSNQQLLHEDLRDDLKTQHADVIHSLSRMEEQVKQRMQRLEQNMTEQQDRLHERQLDQFGPKPVVL